MDGMDQTYVQLFFQLIYFLDGLAKKFGLTPEQFGENLRDNYQRHEVEQEPTEPMEVAKEYISKYVTFRSIF